METTLVPNFYMNYTSNDEELEKDKNLLKNHPLFPVISYLQYEIDHHQNQLGNIPEEHLKVEEKVRGFIQEFSQEMRKANPAYTPDPEVDSFVLDSIRKLRYDLMELQEVTKYANRFVPKYQNALEGASEQYKEINEVERETPSVTPQRPSSAYKTEPNQQEMKPPLNNNVNQEFPAHPSHAVPAPIDYDSNLTVGHSNLNPFDMKNSPSSSIEDGRSSVASSTDTNESKKNFSKETIKIMEAWLHQHLERPYPSEPEKEELAHRCGISKIQVNNWFINVRRRKVPRLLSSGSKKNEPMKSTFADANNNIHPQLPQFPGIFPNPMFPMYPGHPMQNPMGQQMGQFQNLSFPGGPMFPGNGFNPMQFPNMMGGPMPNLQMAQMRPPGLQDFQPGPSPQAHQPIQSPFHARESVSPYQNQTPPVLEQLGNHAPMQNSGPLQMNFQNMGQFYGNQNL